MVKFSSSSQENEIHTVDSPFGVKYISYQSKIARHGMNVHSLKITSDL